MPILLLILAKVFLPYIACFSLNGLIKIIKSVGKAAIDMATIRIVLVIYIIRTGDIKERACFNPLNSKNLGSGYITITRLGQN